MYKNILFASFMFLFFTGCAMKAPIETIDTNIEKISNNLSFRQIERSIYKAATELGWRLYKNEDGYIVGHYYTPRYTASIDIKYTQDSYSISYNQSENLKHDGEQILSLYNTWIKELDKKIQDIIIQTANSSK